MADERVVWMDISRGIAVLAIVLMHVTLITYVPFAADEPRQIWDRINNTTWPFHLSTLFVVSGLGASKRLRQGLSAVGAPLKRTAYLYVVWSAIYVVLMTMGVNVWARSWENLPVAIGELAAPKSVLWFLLGLVFWTFILAWAYRIPPAVMLAVTLIAAVGSYWLPGSRAHDQYIHIISYGVFFAIGVYLRPWIMRTVGQHPWVLLVSSTSVFVLFSFARAWDSRRTVLALTEVPWMLAAASMLISFSAILGQIGGVRRLLSEVGRRTLPIYVLHIPLAATIALAPIWDGIAEVLGGWTPVAALTVVTMISLLVYFLAVRTPARALFKMSQR